MFLAECWEELFAGFFSGFVQEKGQKPGGAAHFLAALHSVFRPRIDLWCNTCFELDVIKR